MTTSPDEGDSADAVDFKDIDIDKIAETCSECGEPLEEGDCVNVTCFDSPLYDEDEDLLNSDEDEDE